MKTSKPKHSRGFTLVEILVVIAIIVILAAAGFTAGPIMILKAQKVRALGVCSELELGVNSFFNDYGSLPTYTEGGSEDEQIATDNNVEMLNILHNFETDANPLNRRGIKYISIKEGKGNKNGIIYSDGGDSVEGLYDPWGGPYNVILDTDYDERITVQPSGASSSKTLNGRRVAVWSDGSDAAEGSGDEDITDDVTTW